MPDYLLIFIIDLPEFGQRHSRIRGEAAREIILRSEAAAESDLLDRLIRINKLVFRSVHPKIQDIEADQVSLIESLRKLSNGGQIESVVDI